MSKEQTRRNRLGERLLTRWDSIVAYSVALVTAIAFAIGIMTPPISGHFCTANCIDYPYLDTLSRFPRDYFWMPFAILFSLLYVALTASIHEYASAERKAFSRIAFSLATMAATILFTNYFIQLTVIPASLAQGQTDGISLWTQYNPHGLFIALEEAGYLLMAASFASVAPVFRGRTRLIRAIRWVFGLAAVLAAASFVVVLATYGVDRGYLYEVVIISIVWTTLIVVGVLIGRLFDDADTGDG